MIDLRIRELNSSGASRNSEDTSTSTHKLSKSEYNKVAEEASARGMAFNSISDYGCRIYNNLQQNAGNRMVTIKDEETRRCVNSYC
jgi:hypothetical protein